MIWPHLPVVALHELGFTGCQVTQTERDKLTAAIEAVAPAAIVALLHRFISAEFEALVKRVEELPRSASDKAETYVCLL